MQIISQEEEYNSKNIDKHLDNIKIGMWFSYCCYLDLQKIETDEEFKEIKEDIKTSVNFYDESPVDIWDNEIEALESFKCCGLDDNDIDKHIQIAKSKLLGGRG